MKYKIFVDGQEGTTGLKIHERLASRDDLEILRISEEQRKDVEARRAFLNDADIVFLCLPDAAARESVSLIANDRTRVIDASTAHRTDPTWIYGLPELSPAHREQIRKAKRVSVPGCHATGFILAIYPLIAQGILPKSYPVTCHSVTGYSGGGKKLIGQYQAENVPDYFAAPRHYALGLQHKHLPEMQYVTGLTQPPLFNPILGNFYAGMAVAVPLMNRLLSQALTAKEVHTALASYYQKEHFVTVLPFESANYLDDGCLNPTTCNDTNRAEIFVFGHEEQTLIMTRFDNLGKGSSSAAVQCMNIMLGLGEQTGMGS